ncbi:renal dipeptidase [Xylaria bambusicola]|uniref:renal dipeptidase n=1 Tax=Xylaria bambusicola TaxID=326684 RepID=UPI0020085B06|nr:renal dipeptidase [Xylaria bambusicola]KAI0526155.1 renal dipeptidase [Xylaria bambusicola]
MHSKGTKSHQTGMETGARSSRHKFGLIVTSFTIFLVVVGYHCHQITNVAIPTHGETRDGLDIAPIIDGHVDFPIWIRAFYQNHIYQQNFTREGPLYGQVDFPRLEAGHLRGAFWSVYVECPSEPNDHSDAAYQEIIHDTLQQIDLVYRLVREFPGYLKHAFTAADVERELNDGKSQRVISLMGIEGLHQIGNSASILRMYHSLGVRYATLTHTCHNAYADSEEPKQPLHSGLSSQGRAIVTEMNRLGMIVDISHTSFDTQRDVLGVSLAPVIYSHSNAYTMHNHTRNVPDDKLLQLKVNDGVIMVAFYPEFLGDNASLALVADHAQYIGEKIGYRHVGIGSDFDGMAEGPTGLEDVSKYPDLIQVLRDRGVRETDIRGVAGFNVLRVLKRAEEVAKSLDGMRPLEDDVKPFF